MPNWVEGKLKVRGKPEDIKRWVEECLHCYTTNWLGDGAHTELAFATPVNVFALFLARSVVNTPLCCCPCFLL